jgi:hypothetical protein
MAAHELIFHGRQICVARRPRCETCPVNPLCPKIGVPLEIRRAATVGASSRGRDIASRG